MDRDTLLKIAEQIREGKATEEEKTQFLQAMRFEFQEVAKILSDLKK